MVRVAVTKLPEGCINAEQELQKFQKLLDESNVEYSLEILENIDDMKERIQEIKNSPMYLKLEFHTQQGVKSIPVSDLVLFEYCQKQVHIQTLDSNYQCRNTLQNVISLVGSHGFAYPHKSFIVNLRHIAKIKGYNIAMCNGSIVPLSQKKSKEFRLLYKNYLASIASSCRA